MSSIVDLHIHSRYSRACSRQLTPENIAYWARVKGIQIVGTGDFTHPAWFSELEQKLEEVGTSGFYRLREKYPVTDTSVNIPALDIQKTLFVCTSEISCIYSQGGKVRRVHLLVVAPSLSTVKKINDFLDGVGNLKADGRPILGINAAVLTEKILNIDPRCVVIPAHAWTPWFAVFGSKSGFDSLEECFGKMTPFIFAIETGLSSDPAMNWRVSGLDSITLLSNSDAHSGANLGREANVFDLRDVNYDAMVEIIRKKDPNQFLFTIEFYPEEGKYHFDGHRLCKVALAPEQTRARQGICPICKKEMTIGVLSRVQVLADRPDGYQPESAIPYRNLVPLQQVIADVSNVSGKWTKRVREEYARLVSAAGSEFAVLLDIPYTDLALLTSARMVEGIRRNREGHVRVQPGFDGEYGKIEIFHPEEKSQMSAMLF